MTLATLLFLLGITLIFVGIAAAGIFWAIKNGQYDDLEGPAQRILMDDDDPMIPFNRLKQNANQHKINENSD
ncbi:MAG: cbb3-type cytochrome oxidase assembly protein CcoS [Methylophilaceae bacterium]|uniref:cbb3-type cytochrome oxidase assembly protein CcoS n=1 Tax=Methylovorus sp. MM2 TaxID=1848038 RepID=UPI0007E08D95|nr:cbb3-type cytochrome oxidase assembly protein CcoS [Methylovorus sp. MM2]OAM52465.1 cytochrome oxidase maturation protein, cbb3-type [Methylovorus sp. MM2]